jgi:hypothetical protein
VWSFIFQAGAQRIKDVASIQGVRSTF